MTFDIFTMIEHFSVSETIITVGVLMLATYVLSIIVQTILLKVTTNSKSSKPIAGSTTIIPSSIPESKQSKESGLLTPDDDTLLDELLDKNVKDEEVLDDLWDGLREYQAHYEKAIDYYTRKIYTEALIIARKGLRHQPRDYVLLRIELGSAFALKSYSKPKTVVEVVTLANSMIQEYPSLTCVDGHSSSHSFSTSVRSDRQSDPYRVLVEISRDRGSLGDALSWWREASVHNVSPWKETFAAQCDQVAQAISLFMSQSKSNSKARNLQNDNMAHMSCYGNFIQQKVDRSKDEVYIAFLNELGKELGLVFSEALLK